MRSIFDHSTSLKFCFDLLLYSTYYIAVSQTLNSEPEFLNIYWRLKSRLSAFREELSFQRSERTTGFGHAVVFVC
jgi:hypothetical protein